MHPRYLHIIMSLDTKKISKEILFDRLMNLLHVQEMGRLNQLLVNMSQQRGKRYQEILLHGRKARNVQKKYRKFRKKNRSKLAQALTN